MVSPMPNLTKSNFLPTVIFHEKLLQTPMHQTREPKPPVATTILQSTTPNSHSYDTLESLQRQAPAPIIVITRSMRRSADNTRDPDCETG
ncbi:hypothetical protein M758_11G138800 [Ceratodon purpureus]|nr:hypothetical protein M758_11G138800 [Ceratodon purpureus]